jgi:hypothetical protein
MPINPPRESGNSIESSPLAVLSEVPSDRIDSPGAGEFGKFELLIPLDNLRRNPLAMKSFRSPIHLPHPYFFLSLTLPKPSKGRVLRMMHPTIFQNLGFFFLLFLL